ncbi:MAG: hypothetical protein Q4B58_07710, partial [Bacteroidales bacterium]|nr:hypothetical protein [Bacteroidales bacterium]
VHALSLAFTRVHNLFCYKHLCNKIILNIEILALPLQRKSKQKGAFRFEMRTVLTQNKYTYEKNYESR